MNSEVIECLLKSPHLGNGPDLRKFLTFFFSYLLSLLISSLLSPLFLGFRPYFPRLSIPLALKEDQVWHDNRRTCCMRLGFNLGAISRRFYTLRLPHWNIAAGLAHGGLLCSVPGNFLHDLCWYSFGIASRVKVGRLSFLWIVYVGCVGMWEGWSLIVQEMLNVRNVFSLCS